MRVVINSFQVGAMYFINESGYQPYITSVCGVPASDIVDAGVYEKNSRGQWESISGVTDEDPAVKQSFIDWLSSQGVSYSERNGEIIPDMMMPNNPAPVYGCVYSDGSGDLGVDPSNVCEGKMAHEFDGDAHLTNQKNDDPMDVLLAAAGAANVEPNRPSKGDGETVSIGGKEFRVKHIGVYDWSCGEPITEFGKACKHGFESFWAKFGDDFDLILDALTEVGSDTEYLQLDDFVVAPIKEILDLRRFAPMKEDLRQAALAFGNFVVGKQVPGYDMAVLRQAKFEIPSYCRMYEYILRDGKITTRA